MHSIFQNSTVMPIFGMSISPSIFYLLVLWSLAWKAWALWLAARRGEKIWFGALLVINTLGLLDIFYIFFIAKKSDTPPVSSGESNS